MLQILEPSTIYSLEYSTHTTKSHAFEVYSELQYTTQQSCVLLSTAELLCVTPAKACTDNRTGFCIRSEVFPNRGAHVIVTTPGAA